ncbi:MAG TPA: dihydroneopterin aldolase [Kiloniellales bacterium]|nr:dihydroneopterin aldolase [Kiloniellales bacterium]
MREHDPRCGSLALLVEDLAVFLRIGVSDAERRQPQRVLVTLKAEVEPRLSTRDSIDEVVDYGWFADQVRDLAGREMKLLETLGAEIARRLFREPRLLALEVTLRKPDLFTDLAAIGLRLQFFRRPE